MAYEFKRLSDVEVVETPTDSANVLIEEDGVIKKAPKTVVGKDDWDAVIDLGIGCYTASLDASEFSFTKGSFEILSTKLKAGEKPNVLFTRVFSYGDTYYEYYIPSNISLYGNENITFGWSICDDMTYIGWCKVEVTSDGIFSFEYRGASN